MVESICVGVFTVISSTQRQVDGLLVSVAGADAEILVVPKHNPIFEAAHEHGRRCVGMHAPHKHLVSYHQQQHTIQVLPYYIDLAFLLIDSELGTSSFVVLRVFRLVSLDCCSV